MNKVVLVCALLIASSIFACAHADCSNLAVTDAATGAILRMNFTEISDQLFQFASPGMRIWMWKVCNKIPCGPAGSITYPMACLSTWQSIEQPGGYWDREAVVYNSTSKTVSFLLAPAPAYQATVQVVCDPTAEKAKNVLSPNPTSSRPILSVTHRSACFPDAPPVQPPTVPTGLVIKGLTYPDMSGTCAGTPSVVELSVANRLHSCVVTSDNKPPYKVTQCNEHMLSMHYYAPRSDCFGPSIASMTYPANMCLPDWLTRSGGSFMYLGCKNVTSA